MALLIISFLAGVLTVVAPCVLPLLPVIVGGALLESRKDKVENQWFRPLVIAASLAVSVVLFTLLLKASTSLLGVPQVVWQIVSGLIVLLLGVNYLWPKLWEIMPFHLKAFQASNKALGKAYHRKDLTGAILIGAALGPVFSSCSPTYAFIVATVLKESFAQGLIYLLTYAIGLSVMLLLIAYLGQAFVSRLRWLVNPKGWFVRTIGILFIFVGIAVLFGLDKKLQAAVLENGWYDPISSLERRLR